VRSQKKSPNPHFPIGRSGTDVDGDDGICPHSSRRTNNCQDTLLNPDRYARGVG
jgi:hypothetical protein